MFKRFALSLICVSALLFTSFSAHAKDEESDAPGLDNSYPYEISFVRKPGILPNEAVLRITKPISVSGCVSIKSPIATMKMMPPRLEAELSETIIKLDRSKQYAHYECSNGSNAIQTDIILNRDDIIDNNITALDIKAPMGRESYEIDINEESIHLEPKSEVMFKPKESTFRDDPLTHWFYPENLVVLSAPQANEDVSGQIDKFAKSRGLVSAASVLTGFEPPSSQPNVLYFIDEGEVIYKTLSQEESSVFGHVTVQQILVGPEGPYKVPRKLNIIARLPGLNE